MKQYVQKHIYVFIFTKMDTKMLTMGMESKSWINGRSIDLNHWFQRSCRNYNEPKSYLSHKDRVIKIVEMVEPATSNIYKDNKDQTREIVIDRMIERPWERGKWPEYNAFFHDMPEAEFFLFLSNFLRNIIFRSTCIATVQADTFTMVSGKV